MNLCVICGKKADLRQGNQFQCEKHYRFKQMYYAAKGNGKVAPSYDELEKMIPKDMKCGDCGRTMNWRQRDGADTVLTLQHYRDGTLALVCMHCNSRHAHMEGDSYRDLPAGHKKCVDCSEVKPFDQFHASNTRRGVMKKTSQCIDCSALRTAQWRENNRDEYNQYMREYRAKRKAAGAPVKRGS